MKCYKMKTKHKYFCAIEIGFCLHSIPISNIVANEKQSKQAPSAGWGVGKWFWCFDCFKFILRKQMLFCFRYRYGIVIMYTVYWTQIVHLLYLAVNFRIVWEEKKKTPHTHFEITWNYISETFRLWCAWSLNCYIKCVHIFLFCLAGNEIYIEKSNYSINDARRWRQFIYVAVENVNLWG